jgi:hypothetical protein
MRGPRLIPAKLDALLVDRLIELYCAWREECSAVHAAYEQLSAAEATDRRLAFAVFLAALDREATAARVYAEQVTQVSSQVGITSGRTVSEAPAGRGSG